METLEFDFNNTKSPNCEMMFYNCNRLSGTFNIKSKLGFTNGMFNYAATVKDAKIILNYTEELSNHVDETLHNSALRMGQVVKGELIE